MEPSFTKCDVLTRERDTGVFVCVPEERPNEIIVRSWLSPETNFDATITWVSGLHDFEKNKLWILLCGILLLHFELTEVSYVSVCVHACEHAL